MKKRKKRKRYNEKKWEEESDILRNERGEIMKKDARERESMRKRDDQWKCREKKKESKKTKGRKKNKEKSAKWESRLMFKKEYILKFKFKENNVC